ncbi:MAG: type VI secretion system needle protein Hcp [Prolixibacteraceae bacterium]|nr:type VI secretion system needle protein Hcp [Bacteroidales bacterium]MBN2636041.1 type VI secretion system needle protein Hcp [Prolixibacteraceae bacterium]
MSFKAIFKVDGKEYRVLNCSYSLHQEIDNTGRPSSTARGGVVNLVVESTDDTSLLAWMCDSYKKQDATITFNKRDEDSKMKELEIKEAYMVDYEEAFDNSGDGAMIQSFSLSARSIKMGDGDFENEWPM